MHAHAHTHTHTHSQSYQGNETEEKVFKMRKVFKEDLKELTELEWQNRGSFCFFCQYFINPLQEFQAALPG